MSSTVSMLNALSWVWLVGVLTMAALFVYTATTEHRLTHYTWGMNLLATTIIMLWPLSVPLGMYLMRKERQLGKTSK